MNPFDDVDHDIKLQTVRVPIVDYGHSFLKNQDIAIMKSTALSQYNQKSKIIERSSQLVRMETEYKHKIIIAYRVSFKIAKKKRWRWMT